MPNLDEAPKELEVLEELDRLEAPAESEGQDELEVPDVLDGDNEHEELDRLDVGAEHEELDRPDGDDEYEEPNGDSELLELENILVQRSATYALLSRLYQKEVSRDLLNELHGKLYPAESTDKDLHTGYLYLATYLSNLWSGSLSESKVDYARCFLGHGVDGFSAAYPFESVYTSEKRLTMQGARDEVLAIYRANGIEKLAKWKDGEDHISLELEFMRILCDRAKDALSCGDINAAHELHLRQHDFLNNHLIAWVPMLLADMKKFAQTKLYLGLAYLTEGFLRTDAEFLNDLLFAVNES
ncbi:MAG: molecular chaperone TorD family protein [Coriobacteriales bacterium]|nr:molecular chaperone TorD family protein [Coriobacteriales bacterium]